MLSSSTIYPQENQPAESHRDANRRRYQPEPRDPEEAALSNPEEARLRYAIRAIAAMNAEQYAEFVPPFEAAALLEHLQAFVQADQPELLDSEQARAATVSMVARLGGMEGDEHARALLGALVNRADELALANRRQPLSEVHLRERLGLHPEAELGYRDVLDGINRLTRYQARILLDDLDRALQPFDWLSIGTQAVRTESLRTIFAAEHIRLVKGLELRRSEPETRTIDAGGDTIAMCLWLLGERAGDFPITDLPDDVKFLQLGTEGARRTLDRIERSRVFSSVAQANEPPYHRRYLDAVWFECLMINDDREGLEASLRELAAADPPADRGFEFMRPADARDQLARRIDRPSFIDETLTIKAARKFSDAALRARAPTGDAIGPLWVAAGLAVYDDAPSSLGKAAACLHMPQLPAGIQNAEGIDRFLSQCSPHEVLRLLRGLEEIGEIVSDEDIFEDLGDGLHIYAGWSGIEWAPDANHRPERARTLMRTLFRAAGWPDLTRLDLDGVIKAVARVPYDVAKSVRHCCNRANDIGARGELQNILGTPFVDAARDALDNVVGEFPTLRELAMRNVPLNVAWLKLAGDLERGDLAEIPNGHRDARARLQMALEIAAANQNASTKLQRHQEALARRLGLEEISRGAQVAQALAQRPVWAELGKALGCREVIKRFSGTEALHLVDKALKHTNRERDGIPRLLERAGLAVLERARAWVMLAGIASRKDLSKDHADPAARNELAVELAAGRLTPMAQRLVRISGLNDLVQSPEVRKAAQQLASRRKLAQIVGRHDLIGQRGNGPARELAAASLANGSQIRGSAAKCRA